MAGALPFVHGLVDVPLHRESIFWLSALLVGLASPDGLGIGAKARWMWRGFGAVFSVLGILVLAGVLAAPSQEAEGHLDKARALLKEDAKLVESGIEAEGQDPIETALEELDLATSYA